MLNMREELQELWRFRELLISLVARDLKIRYKNSVIGFFWSFLTPLLTVAVMTFAFNYVMGVGIPNYGAYIFATILPYNFFTQSLLDSSQAVLSGHNLIRKVYFPREVLPLAIIISNFVHFVLGLVVFFFYLLVIWTLDPRVIPFQASAVFVPIIIFFNLCLTIGFGLAFCAINTFYEDTKYVLSILLFLLMYLMPVVIFVEQIRYKVGAGLLFYKLTYLNPLSAFIIAYRKLLLAPQGLKMNVDGHEQMVYLPLEWKYVWLGGAVSIFVLFWGYNKFNKVKWKFAER